MTCRYHHPLNTLLKSGEKAYLICIAFKEKKRDREEITRETRETFSPEEVRRLYGVSLDEYVDAVLERENRVFGDLEHAFIPSDRDYGFVSESKFGKAKKEMLDRLESFPKLYPKDWKIVHTELKNGTTEALKELFSKADLNFVDDASLPRGQWDAKLEKFVDLAKSQPFVSKAYLTGSLARGAASSKDADVIMVRDHCPEDRCEIQMSMNSKRFNTELKIIGRGFPHCPIDLYCFSEREFKKLGGYRLSENKKLLFQR